MSVFGEMTLTELLAQLPTARLEDPDRYLSGAEAAKLLGVPEKTVGNLARDERIPSVKIGNRRVYRRSALLARMEEAERTGLAI